MVDDAISGTYERDGYLVQRGILAADELGRRCAHFLAAEVDAYAGRMLAEGKIGFPVCRPALRAAVRHDLPGDGLLAAELDRERVR